MHATRWERFRRDLGGRVPTYGSLFAIAFGIAVAAHNHDLLSGMTSALAILLLVIVVTWKQATAASESEFFTALAPRLGLEYVASGSIPPLTPLLAADGPREYTHVMEGRLNGRLGGPRCTLAHYAYRTIDEDGHRSEPWPFTVCATEVPEALSSVRGVFLRPRGGLVHDWLARRPRPERVELESTDFTERYELLAAPDQDRGVLYALFSPSFVVWLAEHPLGPGFECKGGELVAYLPGHDGSADHLTLLHDATREIARRVSVAVGWTRPLTPAG